MTRSLCLIARDIYRTWTWQKVNPAAKPYLDAMETLISVNDSYGFTPGKTVVLYFLANARTWRGCHARGIKKELRALIKAELKAL